MVPLGIDSLKMQQPFGEGNGEGRLRQGLFVWLATRCMVGADLGDG